MKPSWEAYCLTCCGGGKTLARTTKRKAEAACTSHMAAFPGHTVTLIDRRPTSDGTPVAILPG
jgi:hypothetical protein